MKKIAVYVAGDANIFFPALVALHSIKRRNPEIYDFYIAFDQKHLSLEMEFLIEKYEISFIDTSKLENKDEILTLGKMQEGAWPKEVLLNWVVPEYLYKLGYQYAVKVDYDLICINHWKWDDIDPKDNIFSARYWTQNLMNDGVKESLLSKYNCPALTKYFNAGFCAINLIKYENIGFFKRFLEVYNDLLDSKSVQLAEQVAFAIILSGISNGIKQVPPGYNLRVTTLPELDDEGKSDIKNIHYVSSNKPWRQISFKYIKHYVEVGNRAHLYMYRNIWINEAIAIPESKYYLNVNPMSDLENIEMLTTIFKEIYRNTKK